MISDIIIRVRCQVVAYQVLVDNMLVSSDTGRGQVSGDNRQMSSESTVRENTSSDSQVQLSEA